MASSLPEELVLEILVRLPLDLASASLVCKTWRRALSDRDSFWRCRREFHRAPPPPPLLGYIENPYYGRSPMRFVHTMPSIVCPVIRKPWVDCSGWCALDCRHGRVLILDAKGYLSMWLIVWDPITGSLQHIAVPSASYGSYPSDSYTGAVLCAKEGCDHLDCHGGPFQILLVVNLAGCQFAIATTKFSSLTSAWGAPILNHHSDYRVFSGNGKHSLLIGDILYFPYGHGKSTIIKYDLHALELSDIYLPQHLYGAILMEAEDRELGLATLKDNCICLWLQQDVPHVMAFSLAEVEPTRWVEDRVIMLGTNVPRQVPFESYKVIGFAEGTNTIFINISSGIFILDLETEKVTKVGEREADRDDPILPYMSFYVPRYSTQVVDLLKFIYTSCCGKREE